MRGSNFFFLYYICSLLHIYHAENSLLTKAFAITETAVVKRDETRLGRLSKYKPTEHPWTSFGRVRRRKKGSQKWSGVCTGTLVGRRLIFTARHCRLDEFEEVKFYPALYDGYSKDPEASASISAVWKSSNNWEPNPECAILNDWAFALLDKPLGDRFGYV